MFRILLWSAALALALLVSGCAGNSQRTAYAITLLIQRACRWIGVRVKTERIDTERLRRSLTAYLCGEPTRVAALLREQHDLGERRPRELLRDNLHFDSNLASKYQNAT